MRLQQYFGQLKKAKLLLLRQVVGRSMSPKLKPGQLLLITRIYRRLRPGQVIVFNHYGREKVKRIERVVDNRVFVIGDNLNFSTDSRHFGWITTKEIIGRVVWPKISNH